ncbi:hypothetical protein L211DRAFT_869186 [Terfezia boudieri ATCC MYA-4762]|uniref:Terpenoid synthase n=1 Tax=Terfezia boudieri ATCC MYA-4762 TaxID=1051890 RepID=A0A3N4LIX0_9PEZI|nr:hypothetical protein L211DRAFT_869186 [Terfezia boudieri ATCC MYA-4762]
MVQSFFPQVKHTADTRKNSRKYKSDVWAKAWLAKKVSAIWRMAARRQKRLKKHKEPSYSLSEPDVSEGYSELYRVCCVLSRIPLTTFTAGNSTYHSVKWPVQKLGSNYALTVPSPYSTDIRLDVAIDLSDLLCKLPDTMKTIYEKADPKKLINLMLPEGVIGKEARKVAAAFWLWLCITDDILEAMEMDEDFVQGINDMHAALAGSTNTAQYDNNSQISFITHLFRDMVYDTVLQDEDSKNSKVQWQQNFIACVQEIAHAFTVERPLFNAGKRVILEDWMNLRVVTISARPFMILARASLNIPGGMSILGNPLLDGYQRYTGKQTETETELGCLESTLQCILGLQNDILGWEKDNAENLNLNCIQILIAQGKDSMNPTDTYKLSLTTAIEAHNQLVISAVSRAFEILNGSRNIPDNSSRRESLVPSLCSSDVGNIANGRVSAEASPGTSTVDLCSPTTQQQQPREAEVDIVDTDSEAESRSTREVSFCLFGQAAKFSQSITEISCREARALIHDQEQIERKRICQYVRVLLNMANGMANWMIACKRYAVKNKC